MILKDRIPILENYIDNLCKTGIIPGASFALIDENNIHTNYLGLSELVPEKKPIFKNAIYDLASLTKVIATTTTIMMLIESGTITLDTHICDILPLYKQKSVKIKHLLTHISGHDADIDCKSMTKEELINSVYDNQVDPEKFEKQVLYSDIGFILLGFVVDKLTGSLQNFIAKNLFEPLEMNSTYFNPDIDKQNFCIPTEFCKMRNKMIKGIVHDEKSYVLGGVAGHAGLFSTVDDLSKFVQMYINYGQYKNKSILNPQTIDLVSKCYTTFSDDDRGLGWMVKGEHTILCDIASEKTIYHSGFTGTSIIIDLENKKGFILLSNRVHPSRENIKLVNLRRNIHNIAFSCIK